MQTQKKPKRALRLVGTALLLVVVMLAAAGITFVLMGGLAALPGVQRAPAGYTTQDEVRAMELEAPPAGYDAAAQRSWFGAAVDFATQNNFNTIIFNAKQSLAVHWHDNIFPLAGAPITDEKNTDPSDPLAALCAALEGRPIQLWLAVDPYTATGYVDGSSQQAAKYAAKQGIPAAFAADDATYAELLIDSLSRLPNNYSISGYVFQGFSLATWGQQAAQPAFATEFARLLEDLHTALANQGRLLPLSLRFDEAEGVLNADTANALVMGGTVRYLIPTVADGPELEARLAPYAYTGQRLLAVQPADDTTGLFLFTASHSAGYAGAVMGSYPALAENPTALALQTAATEEVAGEEMPGGFDIPQTLAVSYPAQNARISTKGLFIMGTSDPNLPLTMDGVEIERQSANGAFGVAVELADGMNSYVFSQGGQPLTLNVEKRSGTGGGGGGTTPNDSTNEAKPGQVVQVSALIASALTDPDRDGSMGETLPQGATFVVQNSVRTTRSGKRTWAYQMPSGHYVLASAVDWATGDGKTNFTGIGATVADGGEWLTFEGGGAPAAYVHFEDSDGTLRLTFYDTSLQLPEDFSSTLVSSARVERVDAENKVVLTLQTTGIWGYSLEYTDGQTKLFLKTPPVRGSNPARPLEGVRVMLDPGHGGDDIGSPGLMWYTGPHEKDVNLALAKAIAYRLRQLGAEVLMTREDDSFPTLQDRLAAQTIHKPDFFIAVHHNALDPTSDLNTAKGVECYYYHPYSTPSSQGFAQTLLDKVAAATGRQDRGIDWNYFYVTRTTVCPSVLFEYGFMLNPAEFEDVTSEAGIYAAAFATAEAVLACMP